MPIDVVRPGLMSSIQDLGRVGWRKFGVIGGGAMDTLALRIANLLVDNEPAEAAIEVTLVGPTLRFLKDSLIAIAGGNLSPQVDDFSGWADVPMWRPVWIRAGGLLRFGNAVAGCRTYIAIAGGIDVPEILGSRSTYFQAKLGGLDGRALRAGDRLATKTISPTAARLAASLAGEAGWNSLVATRWHADPHLASSSEGPTVRVTAGRHFNHFPEPERERFFSTEFEITANSDRMGYRLAGPPIQLATRREFLSEGMLPGTIQVPNNGQPIVMMADCPVTGGYPKIAQVAIVDLPVLAQLRPGSKVRFERISVTEAAGLYRAREEDIVRLRCGLAFR